MTMTDQTSNGKTSHPIHLVYAAGRWCVTVALDNNRVYSAKGGTAESALENLAHEIRRGKEEKRDNDTTSD